MTMTRTDTKEQLNVIWEALQGFRETCIPEGQDEEYDSYWDEICTAMGWITEDLEALKDRRDSELDERFSARGAE